jgi:hypothetical protein
MLSKEFFHLRVNRCLQHLLGSLTHNPTQRTTTVELLTKLDHLPAKLFPHWTAFRFCRNLPHGVSSCPRRAADEMNKSPAGCAAFFFPRGTQLSIISRVLSLCVLEKDPSATTIDVPVQRS